MNEVDVNVFRPNTILIFSHSDSNQLTLRRISFSDSTKAVDEYNKLEKSNDGSKDIVLVKADEYRNIRSAFRNYFADTADFVSYVRAGLEQLEQVKQS